MEYKKRGEAVSKSKFVVPADFNIKSVKEFANLNNNYELKVAELYGSLSTSNIGSGRSHSGLPYTSFDDFENYVAECNKNNIEFNYTLNSSCCSNNEFTEKGKKQIIEEIRKLVGIGIRNFTVSLPSLIEVMASEFPDVDVTVSIICGVDSPFKMNFFCQHNNVKNIYIHERVYRNTKLLKEIIDIAHKHNKKTGMIINSFCMPECPLRMFHFNFASHSVLGTSYIVPEYYWAICGLMKIEDKKNLLNSTWVRPEDLAHYIELGIDRLKITGRERLAKSANLHRMIEIYNNQKYDGNLIELFMCFAECAHSEIFDMQNNDEIDFYIKSILNGNHECKLINCNDCTFCESALNTIKVNEDASSKWTEIFNRISKIKEA